MKWTPELDARIAGFLRAEKTARQIGAEMGATRNAIIGRVQRCKMLREIGFARAAHCHKLPSMSVGATRKRGGVHGGHVSKNRLKPVPKPIIAKPALVAPVTAGVPLLGLGPHQCKFAVTPHNAPKDGHLFCGEVVEPGKSWCAWHERIVWGRGTAGETATVKSARRLAA